jgi:hypothetical protein
MKTTLKYFLVHQLEHHNALAQSILLFVILKKDMKHSATKTIFLSLALLVVTANLSPLYAQTSTNILTASGKDLKYKGQTVVLKGVNFDNIPALGATVGENGDTIGSGKIDDINHIEQDYQKLAELGGNTARFGLSFNWYRENKTKFYQVMDQHVAWAHKYGIWIIFNMFTTPGDCYEGYSEYCNIWTNTTEKNQLKAFWVEMATRYKNEPAVGGYDLLNEPTPPGPGWSTTWDNFAQDMITAVRAVDTNHLIFIESTSDPTFAKIFTGGNIVYETHFYIPMGLTHIATTTQRKYPGPFTEWFSGENFTATLNKDAFAGKGDSRLDIRNLVPINWANQKNVPVFVGEWGSRATSPGYEVYTKDIAELFRDFNVNHTFYTWRHDPNYWKWGIYARSSTNPFDLSFPEKLEAVKVSWAGAVKPVFDGVTPTVTPSPSPTPFKIGDANKDGLVNNQDYDIWKTEFLNSQVNLADFNKDTKSNGIDYILWLNNYGK